MGWLLTPLAAWAVSFMGGMAGARLGRGVESPQWGLTLLVLGAAVGAVLGAGLWVWALRRAWHNALRLKRERLQRERAVKREKEKQQKA